MSVLSDTFKLFFSFVDNAWDVAGRKVKWREIIIAPFDVSSC